LTQEEVMTITAIAPDQTVTEDVGAAIEALAGRIFEASVGATEMVNIHLGIALGLYRHLADAGHLTSAELAARAGTDERYTREWLQAQAVSGFVTIDGPDVRTASFALPPAAAEVLLNELSPGYLGPLPSVLATVGAVIPDLVDAFRTGAGVPYAAYPGGFSLQAALNRPAFHHELVASWLPAVPDIATRLGDETVPARVADLGCGAGWASIALAAAYPHIRIDGYDADEESIAMARRNAADAGVADRVTFEVCDLAEAGPETPRYDLALLFECLHDMAHPDRVLAVTRGQLVDGGSVIVADEATDDELVAATPDPVQRFFANVSPLWCLPQGRVEPDAYPVGTVFRTGALRELASGAGFGRVDVLPIEHMVFRFYRLRA
jgi:predicted O-methyltransferase YrrM